jgi:hypothetical protein
MRIVLIIAATIVALLSALFGLASGVARNTTDPIERKYATQSAMASLVVFVLCAAAIVSLAGCADLKYVECLARDGTSRPCN